MGFRYSANRKRRLRPLVVRFMTRFKELKRIESAIEHKDKKEILWALDYGESRLELAKMKSQIKHWSKLIDKLKSEIVTDV